MSNHVHDNVNVFEGEKKKKIKKEEKISFKDFYKKELFRKHLTLFIICLFVFIVAFLIGTNVNEVDFSDIYQNFQELCLNGKTGMIKNIFTEKLAINALILLSGFTPYIYVPVIGILYAYNVAFDLVAIYQNLCVNVNILTFTIGSIVQVFGISLSVAAGIYLCKLSTKRFKYAQKMDFTINDVKKEWYEIRKNQEKLEEVQEKQKKREEKIEALNVKIPYRYLILTFIISSFIVLIGGFIAVI
mgnify:FL=1